MIISAKIDVKKIEKARLYEGAKGTYLDAVIFLNDEADQYGNHGMIVQSVTKEEKEAGVKGAILGNIKILKGAPAATAKAKQQEEPIAANSGDDDLPF